MSKIVEIMKLEYLVSLMNEHMKIVGIDFGTKKIGTALFHQEFDAVIPMSILTHFQDHTEAIEQLIRENSCAAVVIGVCSSGRNVKTVLDLQKSIQNDLGLPVFLQDETLTTYTANEILREAGMHNYRKRNQVDDAIAAQLILEDFICDFKRYIYMNKKAS